MWCCGYVSCFLPSCVWAWFTSGVCPFVLGSSLPCNVCPRCVEHSGDEGLGWSTSSAQKRQQRARGSNTRHGQMRRGPRADADSGALHPLGATGGSASRTPLTSLTHRPLETAVAGGRGGLTQPCPIIWWCILTSLIIPPV